MNYVEQDHTSSGVQIAAALAKERRAEVAKTAFLHARPM